MTYLALRNFIRERLELLAHLVDPCGRIGERIARRGDVRFNLFYMGTYFRDGRKKKQHMHEPSSSIAVCISFC